MYLIEPRGLGLRPAAEDSRVKLLAYDVVDLAQTWQNDLAWLLMGVLLALPVFVTSCRDDPPNIRLSTLISCNSIVPFVHSAHMHTGEIDAKFLRYLFLPNGRAREMRRKSRPALRLPLHMLPSSAASAGPDINAAKSWSCMYVVTRWQSKEDQRGRCPPCAPPPSSPRKYAIQ